MGTSVEGSLDHFDGGAVGVGARQARGFGRQAGPGTEQANPVFDPSRRQMKHPSPHSTQSAWAVAKATIDEGSGASSARAIPGGAIQRINAIKRGTWRRMSLRYNASGDRPSLEAPLRGIGQASKRRFGGSGTSLEASRDPLGPPGASCYLPAL